MIRAFTFAASTVFAFIPAGDNTFNDLTNQGSVLRRPFQIYQQVEIPPVSLLTSTTKTLILFHGRG